MNTSIILTSIVLSLGAVSFYLSPNWRRGQNNTIPLVATVASLLHSLLILSNLQLHRPPNLFTRLGIPINAPVDHIRSLLIKEAGDNTMGGWDGVIVPLEIPRDVDALLTKLDVHGSRDMYVRFGQRAVQTCSYCSSAADYAILVLSGILLDYLRTATLLLLLTTNANGRQRLRTDALGALTFAFLIEVYAFTHARAVPLEKDARTAFMLHDNLFLSRNMFLLVFPVVIQRLPAIYPPPPASVVLTPVVGCLERTLPRVHLLRYFRQAVLRHPYTRDRVVKFWANDAADGAAARSNPNVQKTASKLGLGFASPTGSEDRDGQEGALRVNARMAVQSLKPLFMPPPN